MGLGKKGGGRGARVATTRPPSEFRSAVRVKCVWRIQCTMEGQTKGTDSTTSAAGVGGFGAEEAEGVEDDDDGAAFVEEYGDGEFGEPEG